MDIATFHAGHKHDGTHSRAGNPVEPAVSITRDGKLASGVKGFNSLISADGKNKLAKEVATDYEPSIAANRPPRISPPTLHNASWSFLITRTDNPYSY